MAHLIVKGSEVIVRLQALEGLAAWRRELRVPIECLRMVHVEEVPLSGLARLRLPGLSWPGTFTIGSCRRDGRREFAAVHAGLPAVVLDAEGARWDRVVVSHRDAVKVAAELAGLILSRGPGHGGPSQRHVNGHGGLTLQRGALPSSEDQCCRHQGPPATRVARSLGCPMDGIAVAPAPLDFVHGGVCRA